MSGIIFLSLIISPKPFIAVLNWKLQVEYPKVINFKNENLRKWGRQ